MIQDFQDNLVLSDQIKNLSGWITLLTKEVLYNPVSQKATEVPAVKVFVAAKLTILLDTFDLDAAKTLATSVSAALCPRCMYSTYFF